jgi:hypothetical protein
MFHTGCMQIEWDGLFEIRFFCESCKPTVIHAISFPEVEEVLEFLIGSELDVPAGELAIAVGNAIARPRVPIRQPLCLSDDRLRIMFPAATAARAG